MIKNCDTKIIGIGENYLRCFRFPGKGGETRPTVVKHCLLQRQLEESEGIGEIRRWVEVNSTEMDEVFLYVPIAFLPQPIIDRLAARKATCNEEWKLAFARKIESLTVDGAGGLPGFKADQKTLYPMSIAGFPLRKPQPNSDMINPLSFTQAELEAFMGPKLASQADLLAFINLDRLQGNLASQVEQINSLLWRLGNYKSKK